MKTDTPRRWLEPSVAVMAAVAVMIVFMWAGRSSLECVRAHERHRTLSLSDSVDRDHLETDLAAAGRTARRYATRLGGGMTEAARKADRSSSHEADWQSRVRECEATLTADIAVTHGLAVEDVRATARHGP